MAEKESSTQKRLTAPVKVKWSDPKPKNGGTVPSGTFKGRDRKELREISVIKTKEALEHANIHNPPRDAQWTEATIRHGFEVDSSKKQDKYGQWGTSKPHVNAEVRASNNYKKTVHIGYNARIDPKSDDKEQGPFGADENGNWYQIQEAFRRPKVPPSNQKKALKIEEVPPSNQKKALKIENPLTR